jgi:8-amino-7-oxononanoate synthase
MDLLEQCFFPTVALAKASGIYPYFVPLSASDGPVVQVAGRPVVMLGSNNYLGLTHHPSVLRAAHEAIDRFGTGCTGSRFLNGNLELHETLERELAEFTGREAALVFSSGFLANLGTVALLGSIDGAILFSDRENHASLIDGVRMAHADVRVFRDLDDLERQLCARASWPEALVVTDAVFSMTGRVADLRRLATLRRRHGFHLYLDDAHGFGVLGPQGRGTAAAQGVDGDVDILFATFSKALASLGGFVAASADLIEYVRHKARTLIFSAALPPASAAAALAALRVLRSDAALFERLWRNVRFFREGIEEVGYSTLGSTTPIIPLFVGSESLACRMCRDALEMGVFATPVLHPAVPFGQALIRTSVTPAHRMEHLERAVEVFASLRRRYPIPEVDVARLPVKSEMDLTYFLSPAPPAQVDVAPAP